jgi:hypothetical protein
MDFTLNLWHVLVSTGQIKPQSSIQLWHTLLKWLKFTIYFDEHNLKPSLEIKIVHSLQSFEDCNNFLAGHVHH